MSPAAERPGREDRALDRAAGARPIPGNALTHYADSRAALEAMLGLVAGARRWVHFENYIIRGDHTGRRFAQALAERARAGVRVRVLYDAFGSLTTRSRLWRDLRAAGGEVRRFNPLITAQPFRALRRDHRKLVVADGTAAMIGGVCIGDEWAGDTARRRQPWRDTMLEVRGPAASALDATFAHTWGRAGAPLDGERAADPAERGGCAVRVVEGLPERSRVWRLTQLLSAVARDQLWITDPYLVAPSPLFAGLLDAARDGVDVRVLVPGTSDVPLVRAFTRAGYRDLLHAGVRVFEWRGPMLHAKTAVADRRWVRVGSSNLNASSLIANYELDVLVQSEELGTVMSEQYRRDLGASREVVLMARRRLPPRITATPAETESAAHRRFAREYRDAAVVALRQVAGGVRRRLAAIATLASAAAGALFLAFPRQASIALAVVAFWLALSLGAYAVTRRRRAEGP